jgi:AICAR transformylase/IMP cyclohydrolase PurH
VLQTGEPLDHAGLRDLAFAWRCVRAVKSNAILLAQEGATVGVGMGQVNRVDAARLAVARAGERAAGSLAASDAFFPFPDGLQVLLDAGVRAVVQPGGSVRDDEVFAAAREAGVTLYTTAPATSPTEAAGARDRSGGERRAQTAHSGSDRRPSRRCSTTGSSKPPAARW